MLRSSQSVRFEVGNYVNQNENWRRLVPVGLIIEIRVDVGSVGMRRTEIWRENIGIPLRRNSGSCSGGFGPHYELRGRGNHDDSDFGDIIKKLPVITVHLTPAAQRHRYYRLFAITLPQVLMNKLHARSRGASQAWNFEAGGRIDPRV
ncbi:hypothetical protein G5I_12068 [Acromyrmex echinatior]|uniref:Uncharacterized protein n=1 Tax=Acromyrmex echinatior TaxID=103372 RepID=F4X1A9_ACREC|nr:hypothetical protein G5I_12068 [Acromyrmex echinatior]